MNDFIEKVTLRTEMLLSSGAVEAFRAMKVIIFGVGGVGSWCAEALVRTGFGTVAIVDPDTICVSNINRQLQATSLNIGNPKVEELASRLTSINPEIEIVAIDRAFDETSWIDFGLEGYDFVVDAIDSVRDKVLLIEKTLLAARARPGGEGSRDIEPRRPTLFSSMGAAAKKDPARIKVAELGKTTVCPLARIVRRELKARGIPLDFLCVYSDEAPSPPLAPSKQFIEEQSMTKKRINGSLVHVTGVFGFMLAGLVVQEACKLLEK